MQLSAEDEAILNGSEGEGAALAMKVLVGIGEAMDAPRLVPVTRTHVALSNQDADRWFAEKLANLGAKCKVPPTVNPGFCISYFKGKGMASDKDVSEMQRTHDAYEKMGANLTYNCTPYILDNIPELGEVISFSESSATPFVNSVWGARSNREAALNALCSAIIGKTPEYGLLLDEERVATVRVVVDADLSGDFAYQQLGWAVPSRIGNRIPVFEGIPRDVTHEKIKNLCAQLNTAGCTPMFHIVGVTPEAPTLEAALGGKEPEETIVITQDILNMQMRALSDEPGEIDFVMFGCPHLTANQVGEIADIVRGKKLKTEMWLLASRTIYEDAKKNGHLDAILAAGGEIVPETCMDQPVWKHLAGKKGATDSPKCAYYTKRRDVEFVIRDMKTCVEAALEGSIQ